ncbi:lysozyme [Rhizobium johnstonii]|uniref:lysozyme n=1 Tax=Rhizobium johnstonii TaxID=3019933 RepID=UPI003F9B7B0A
MFRNAFAITAFLWATTIAFAQDAERDPPADWIPPGVQVEELSGTLPAVAAPNNAKVRKIPLIALGIIKTFEGWKKNVYDDPVGYCTIGYGHLIARNRCANIDYQTMLGEFQPLLTSESGNKLLLNDTRPARRAVQKLVKKPLTNRQFGALSSFVYNVGAGNFAKSTLLKRLNEAKYDAAAKEFSKWTRAGSVILNGLIRRRNCEASLFRGNGELLPNGLVQCGDALVAVAPAETIDIVKGEPQ